MREGIQFISRRHRRVSGVKPGFTLLEILVTLVVLLVGILAVLRLFPGGFLTIQRTSEATAAQSLATQMMEQQKNLDSVADWIQSMRYSALGYAGIVQGIPPDDMRDLTIADMQALGSPDHPYFFSNINRHNWIVGETFRLPVPTPNPATGSYGSVHVLPQGPIRNILRTSPVDGSPDALIAVSGMPMERTEQSFLPTQERPDPTPVLLNENQYAIDYEKRKIAFFPRVQSPTRPSPPLNTRVFKLLYEYYAIEGGNVVRRSNFPLDSGAITVPDVPPPPPGTALRPRWQPIFQNDPDMPNDSNGAQNPGFDPNLGIVRDTDDVSRNFRLLTHIPVQRSNQAPQWTDDPYEFLFYSDDINGAFGTPDFIPANPGVLLFNPRGYDAMVETTRGPQPFRIRVEYGTFDNHIIREVRSVQNQGPYVIRLSLPYVLHKGDILPDQTEYKGVFRWWRDRNNANSVIPSPELLIYNTATGTEVARLANGAVIPGPNMTPPPNNAPAFSLNDKAGQIWFNTQFIESNNLRSANLRIFYQAQKEWGMQLQKAISRYTLAAQPTGRDWTYRSYYIGGSAPNGAGSKRRIYFPASESGKMVILGEYFVKTNMTDAQGNPVIKRFSGEAYRLNDNLALNATFVNNQATWLDLESQHPEAVAENWELTSAPTGVACSSVQGASVKARIIWRDTGRWRRRDNETMLVQPSLR